MYNVFINEKRLILNNNPENTERNIVYEDPHQFDMVLDLLQNTSTKDVTIYFQDIETLWKDFQAHFKNIFAAGGVVKNADDKILFIHRLGKWDLPKGKIEKGESNDEAALREVEEECGITQLEIIQFINSTYHIYVDRDGTNILKTTHWYNMRYRGTKEPIPQIEEGINEVSWKNNSEIERDVLPSTFKNIVLILENYKQKNQ
ncbi:NUDIX hydrolase [Chryseobacterium sp. T1]